MRMNVIYVLLLTKTIRDIFLCSNKNQQVLQSEINHCKVQLKRIHIHLYDLLH